MCIYIYIYIYIYTAGKLADTRKPPKKQKGKATTEVGGPRENTRHNVTLERGGYGRLLEKEQTNVVIQQYLN